MSTKKPPSPQLAPTVRRSRPAPPAPPAHVRAGYEPPKPRKSRLVLAEGEARPSATPPPDAPQQWGQFPGLDPINGWTVPLLGAALSDLKRGLFALAGALADDMALNPFIFRGLETRHTMFTTTPLQVTQASRGEGRRCADFLREVLPDVLPLATLRDFHRAYMLCGFAPGVNEWIEYKDGLDRVWLPKVKPWQTQLTHYQPFSDPRSVDGGAFVATTLNHGLVRMNPGDGRWIMFSQSSLKPWLRGALAILAESFLGDTYNFRDNMAHQDRYGRGILKLFHPVHWKDEEIARAATSLTLAGGGGVLPCPRGPRGEPLVDLDLVKADGTGFMTFDATERRVLRRILLVLLGQDMTSVGQTGGFAQARVHEHGLWREFEQDAAAFGDAALTVSDVVDASSGEPHVRRQWQPRDGVIRKHISRWIALWNFGSFDLAPYVGWNATQPEDTREQADAAAERAKNWSGALQGLGVAIEKLGELGVPFDLAYMLEQIGLNLERPDGDDGPRKLFKPKKPPAPKPAPDDGGDEEAEASPEEAPKPAKKPARKTKRGRS